MHPSLAFRFCFLWCWFSFISIPFARTVPVSLSMPVFQCVSLGLFSFPKPISWASFFSAACASPFLCFSLSTEEDEGKIEGLNGRAGNHYWKQMLEEVCFQHYWAPVVCTLDAHTWRGWNGWQETDFVMVVASTEAVVLFHAVKSSY